MMTVIRSDLATERFDARTNAEDPICGRLDGGRIAPVDRPVNDRL